MPVVIFDIDGTLADASDRLVHIKGPGKKDWKRFYEGIETDRVILPIAYLCWVLREWPSIKIVVASGRETGSAEPETSNWLRKHDLRHDALYLRATGDYRPDDTVKSEFVDRIISEFGELPFLAFEDMPRVIEMYRKRGIFTVDVAQVRQDPEKLAATFAGMVPRHET